MSMHAEFVELRENEKELNKIAEQTKITLNDEFNIGINYHHAIPTIVYTFLKETINYLAKNKEPGSDVSINLMQLLELGITFDECDDAEKANNYVPYAAAGQEFKLLVKQDSIEDEE